MELSDIFLCIWQFCHDAESSLVLEIIEDLNNVADMKLYSFTWSAVVSLFGIAVNVINQLSFWVIYPDRVEVDPVNIALVEINFRDDEEQNVFDIESSV